MRKNIILTVVAVLIIGAVIYLEKGKATHSSLSGGAVSTTTAAAEAEAQIQVQNTTSGATSTPLTLAHGPNYEENKKKYSFAKELAKPDAYINTDGKAIKLSDYIGKKVVLVDFWTYSCINCQRTIPYLESWYKKYGPDGFVIIGVHTPEFDFEKQVENVQAGVKKFGITYPVVLDSEYQSWDTYHNNYWPEEYLIDIDGLVREHNIGEGHYQETETNIQKLLAERSQALNIKTTIPTGFVTASQAIDTSSPETYFNWSRNQYLGNGKAGAAGVQTFTSPGNPPVNTLYLSGTWNIGSEAAESTTAGASILYHYQAKDVYFVASAPSGATLTIYVDGKLISKDKGADVGADGTVHVKEPRLYKLIEHASQEEHTVEIRVTEPGLQAYTFTFG